MRQAIDSKTASWEFRKLLWSTNVLYKSAQAVLLLPLSRQRSSILAISAATKATNVQPVIVKFEINQTDVEVCLVYKCGYFLRARYW
jgi:hypothetical protein